MCAVCNSRNTHTSRAHLASVDGHVRATKKYICITASVLRAYIACDRKSQEIRDDFNGDCDFYPLSMRAASLRVKASAKK